MKKIVVCVIALTMVMSTAVSFVFAEITASKPKQVTITSVRPVEDYTAKVKWKKVSSADGYQIYRSRTDKVSWKLFKPVSSKTFSVTDYMHGKMKYDKNGYKIGYDYSDLNYNWKYKVRAYKKVNGNRVYGNFSTAARWTPDWTIKGIYEESYKYVEAMSFPICEIRDEINPDFDTYFWPLDNGQTYHWKHVIGYDENEAKLIYTDPANGSTNAADCTEKFTDKNSNWGVLWPVRIHPLMTKTSIMKKIKGKLDTEMPILSKANPVFWDNTYNEWGGVDSFTIYYEKYINGYKLWQLW